MIVLPELCNEEKSIGMNEELTIETVKIKKIALKTVIL